MKLVLIFLCLPILTWARPEKIEIWFVSPPSAAKQSQVSKPLPLYAVNGKCEMVGEYCFDPQVGLYKPDDFLKKPVTDSKIQGSDKSVDVAKSVEREMINCDKNNYFDIFCGKAKPVGGASSSFDLWIDTSSSMREMDFTDRDGQCHRSRLVNALDQTCAFNKKVNVMMFDTSLKQAGSIDSLCVNQGLNDYKRMIDWIERSEAKKLVVVTDVYELHKEVADYVEKHHGKIRGDSKALTAADLIDLVPDLAKNCP